MEPTKPAKKKPGRKRGDRIVPVFLRISPTEQAELAALGNPGDKPSKTITNLVRFVLASHRKSRVAP